MLKDIFATSMHGRYSTTDAGQIVEQGQWSYRGHGNAEITVSASAERPVDALHYDLRLHSADCQLDEIHFRPADADGPARGFHAKIAGHALILSNLVEHGGEVLGNITVPAEPVYDGPSPIWLIHLALASPPPTDRVVTTSVVRFNLDRDGADEGFMKLERAGNTISAALLDKEGIANGTITLTLDEDGCPRTIVRGTTETQILRLPSY